MRALKENAVVVIITALTIVSFFGIVFMASNQEQKAQTAQTVDQSVLLTEGTNSIGEATAAATLVEFSDFQCPACAAFYPIVKQLKAKYGADLRVAYKHYPLPQHTFAKKAAEAAEAAGEQGKFWEYHDVLFDNQENLKIEDLKKYAADLGLDTAKFNEALDSGKFTKKVEADEALANKLGINSTPTFYLNGKKLVIREGTDVEKAIKEVLKK